MAANSHEQLRGILFPVAWKRLEDIRSGAVRLVHYTSADSALQILKSRELWLRSAVCMNDYSEVQHGIQCVKKFMNEAPGLAFKKTLDGLFPGMSNTVAGRLEYLFQSAEIGTHIACFSEHYPSEDKCGRLSMWRGYGSNAGVALVLNSRVFLSETNVLNVFSMPVEYLDYNGFASRLEDITQNLSNHASYIRTIGLEDFFMNLLSMLLSSVVSIKHPGFSEEKEWRVVYLPSLVSSQHVAMEARTVNGVPQIVYKVPLKDFPELSFEGASIPKLIDRIIIGPSQFPYEIAKALRLALEENGVVNSLQRIVASDIPLRT